MGQTTNEVKMTQTKLDEVSADKKHKTYCSRNPIGSQLKHSLGVYFKFGVDIALT
jgi:hypothetical protein